MVLGAEKLEGGEPGGRPPEQGPGRASRGNKVSAARPLERSAVRVWAEMGKVFCGPHVSQEPRGLRPAWVGPAPGVTGVGSLSEFL